MIDCSQATSPVFFVNHFESLWGSFNREILSYRPVAPPVPTLQSTPTHNRAQMTSRFPTASSATNPTTSIPSAPFSMFGSPPTSPTATIDQQLEQAQHQQHRADRRPNCRFHVVSVKGFPFFVLASIPGIQLEDDSELIVDKGEQWQKQRCRLDWPVVWSEFISTRGKKHQGLGYIHMMGHEK